MDGPKVRVAQLYLTLDLLFKNELWSWSTYYLIFLLYLEQFVIAKFYLIVCLARDLAWHCKQNLSKFFRRVSSFLVHKSVAKDKHKKIDWWQYNGRGEKIKGKKKGKVKLTFLWALSSSRMSFLRGIIEFRW